MGHVYMIQNIKNGKLYIGSTINFTNRSKAHFRGLKGRYHDNRLLQKDYDIYGNDSFIIVQLCETDNDNERYEIEASIISKLKTYENGYNLTVDGRGKYIITDSTRMKMRRNSKGESNPFYGKKHTKEVIERLSQVAKENNIGENNPFYGRKHTKESLEKMKKSFNRLKSSGWVNPQKGVPKTKQARENNAKAQPNKKPVHAEGKDYISVSACARDLGVVNSTVGNRIKNENFPDYYYIND